MMLCILLEGMRRYGDHRYDQGYRRYYCKGKRSVGMGSLYLVARKPPCTPSAPYRSIPLCSLGNVYFIRVLISPRKV